MTRKKPTYIHRFASAIQISWPKIFYVCSLTRNTFPRSVLVDYLKILISFHLALHHLHVFKLLPNLVKRPGSVNCDVSGCCLSQGGATIPGNCSNRINLLVDMGDPTNSHMSQLAHRSAETYYCRIPGIHSSSVSREEA